LVPVSAFQKELNLDSKGGEDMKKLVLVVLAASLLLGSVSVLACTLPLARRCDGDPDEFQASKVIDGGELHLGFAHAGGGDVVRPVMPARLREAAPGGGQNAARGAGRLRVSVILFGRVFFLGR
jgi:hypothetical protein